jgi:hypothetical protein
MKRLLLISILFSSCKADKTSDVNDVDSVTIEATKSSDKKNIESMADQNVYVSDTATVRLVDNDISADPFVEAFDSMIKKVGQCEIQSKLYENQHNENQIDTILTATFDNSIITYFKEGSQGFILSARIRSDKIEFKRGIRVGMSKLDFLRLFEGFADKQVVDDVTISDEEGLQSVNFKFEDTRLKEVTFQAFFD